MHLVDWRRFIGRARRTVAFCGDSEGKNTIICQKNEDNREEYRLVGRDLHGERCVQLTDQDLSAKRFLCKSQQLIILSLDSPLAKT